MKETVQHKEICWPWDLTEGRYEKIQTEKCKKAVKVQAPMDW